MSDSLLRVVYLSRATHAIDEGALQAILAGSSERNSRDGITGVLCAGRDHYLQVIEGCVGPVMSLYLRIQADRRHRELTLLSISLVGERLFGQWAMAHIEGSARSDFAHEIVLTETSLHQRSDRAAAILRRFVEELKEGAAPVAGAAATS
jgi:hypothetical protein